MQITISGACAITFALSWILNDPLEWLVAPAWIYLLYSLVKNEDSNGTKLSLIASLTFSFYFFQTPFATAIMENFKEKSYQVSLTKGDLISLRFLHLLYLNGFSIILLQIRKLQIPFQSLQNANFRTHLIICGIVSCIMIALPIHRSGNLTNYLMLNKFEMSDIQKLAVFNFKPFILITLIFSCFERRTPWKIYGFTIVCAGIAFEILSLKRYLLVACPIILFFYYSNKSIKFGAHTVIYGFLLVTALNAIKMMYYPIGLVIFANAPISSIFWFSFSDLVSQSILVPEGSGHIILTLNYIHNNIDLNPTHFIHLLASMLPFSGQIFPQYESAGELMRQIVGSPWTGLASSPYLVPFLSFGYFGVLITTALILSWHKLIIHFANTRDPFIIILTFSSLPDLIFYFHREELLLLPKNFIISAASLGVIWVLSQTINHQFLLPAKHSHEN